MNGKRWITVRTKDGQACSLPTDQERAAWIATYLTNVTGKDHTAQPHVGAADDPVRRIQTPVPNTRGR